MEEQIKKLKPRYKVGDKVYEVYGGYGDNPELEFKEYEIVGVGKIRPGDSDIMYAVKYHGAVLYAFEHTLLGSPEELEEIKEEI